MAKKLSTLLILICLCLCFYPLAASFFFQHSNDQLLESWSDSIEQLEPEIKQEALAKAQNYNSLLFQSVQQGFLLKENSLLNDYDEMLSVDNSEIMARIEIPKIALDLAIYHGSDNETLKKGVGHIENSSLPVGGKNCRAILSAHRGLPGASLFTRLDELQEGDLFYIEVLGEILAYQVFDIEVILPQESEKLKPLPDQDLISLVTCTPYGINTHRLVVTGKRIAYVKEVKESLSPQLPSLRELFFLVFPFLLAGYFILSRIVRYRIRKRQMEFRALQALGKEEIDD